MVNEVNFEKDLIINGREIVYRGIFRTDELFSKINRLLEERGYEKREKKTEETVTEEGRRSYVELRPFKEKSSYVILMLKIKIILDNVTEVVEEFEGMKKKFQQGDVTLIFDAWYMTDWENRWGMRPATFFVKGFINKFIYTLPFESGAKGELVQDTAYIYGQLRKFLNSYKGEIGKTTSEEKIVKDVEEDIRKEIEQFQVEEEN